MLPTAAPVPTVTSYPTLEPTLSVLPTSAPTNEPSISFLTQWQAEVDRYERQLQIETASQAQFTNLVVRGRHVLGSCQLWNVFLEDGISTSLILYKAVSVSIVSSTELDVPFSDATTICNNSDTPTRVVMYLNELALAEDNLEVSSAFDCGIDNRWLVGRCDNVAAPYICANCESPCTSNTSLGYLESSTSIIWFNSSCTDSAEDEIVPTNELFRSFVIDYEDLSVASDILDIVTSSPTKSSISVALEVDEVQGAVVCGAFDSPPSDIGKLVLQNQLTGIDSLFPTFVIEGLQPSTVYNVYCATYSSLDVPMAYDKILDTATEQKTACCREVKVEILKASFSNAADVPKVIRISIDSPLPTMLNVSLGAVRVHNGTSVSGTTSAASFIFSPQSVIFSSSSNSFSQEAAYIAGDLTGTFELDFSLGGTSRSEFSVSYSGGFRITVLEAGSPPPLPVLSYAQFSDDGTSVLISFDSATNRGLFANTFVCSAIFSSRSIGDETSCVWVDDVKLLMFSSGINGARLNDTIQVKANTMRAKCQVLQNGGPLCSEWEYALPSNATIIAPSNPIAPLVSLVAPKQIGPCDNLFLDLTGSSGSGGRPFSTISLTAESLHPNVSDVNEFLNTIDSIRTPVKVSNSLLYPGYAYNVAAKMCTFLGSCGRASHRVVVSTSANVPVIFINSEKLRSISRFSPLSIRGNAYTSQCDGSTSTANLVFEWILYEASGGASQVLKLANESMQSVSSDTRVFKLNPYTLEVGKIYTAELTVSHMVSLKSSSMSVEITATKGNIHAVVSVPFEMGLRVDGSFLLDAGESYDEDNNVDFGAAAGLVFYFSCIQHAPSYSETCALVFTSVSSSSVLVSLNDTSDSMIDTIHEIRIIAEHSTDFRQSEVFVTVTIKPASAPSVSLVSESTLRINPTQKLKLLGEVEYSGAGGTAVWSVSDSSIVLDEVSLSDTVRQLGVPTASKKVITMSLVLAPSVLAPQSVYDFTLSCRLNSNFSNSASITISTNAPPRPGQFIVSPENGTMLETLFSFYAIEWEDSDRPMSYSFGYQASSGSYTVQRSRLEVSYFESDKMPSGDENKDYEMVVRLQVFDILDSVAVAYNDLRVVEGASMNVSEMQNFFTTSMSESNGYSDGITEVVSTVTTLINKVNCSGAPDCDIRKREACATVTGTCGMCMDGFVGEEGEANSYCVEDSVENGRLRSSNDIFEVCDSEGVCSVPEKSCPSDCSGNGNCEFVSYFNESDILESCTLIEACLARCACNEGFFGIACESSEEEFTALQQTRHQIVEAVKAISLMDDATADTLNSWLLSLANICSNPVGLLDDTKVLISTMAKEFLYAASDLGLPYEDIASISTTLDLVLSAVSSGDSAPVELLDAYSAFIANDMVEGQSGVVVTNLWYRLATYAVESGVDVTYATPQTVLELAGNHDSQSVFVPSSSDAVSYKLSLVEVLLPRANSSSFLSSPLGLRFDKLPCNATAVGANCSVLITLQNWSPLRYPYRESVANESASLEVEYVCASQVENISLACPGGYNITVECNGTAGQIRQACPQESYTYGCQSIGRDASSCELVSLTKTNITCKCYLNSEDRRLQEQESTTSDDSSISVDFTSAGESILTDFTATWRSVDDIGVSDIKNSIHVLVTIVVIFIVSVTLVLLAWMKDYDENNSKTVNSVQPLPHKSWGYGETKKSTSAELDAALPTVLQPLPVWTKYKAELRSYHRWGGIYFHYSKAYSRPLRMLSLITNVILFLFVEAVTYELADPDDGFCESQNLADECLAETSAFDSSESKCYWDADSGTCHIRDIESDIMKVAVVAVFAAVVGTPFVVFLQFLIQKFLAAETATREKSSRVVVPVSSASSRAQLRRIRSRHISTILPVHSVTDLEPSQSKSTTILSMTAQEELPRLFADIQRYRSTLSVAECKVFDRMWGLSFDDKRSVTEEVRKMIAGALRKILKKHAESVELVLIQALKRVHEGVQQEAIFFEREDINDSLKNKRLIYLFVKDLLSSVNGKILESKYRRDNARREQVLWQVKVGVWIFISSVLTSMLFYIYLFAMRQTESRQKAWFQTFLLWVAFEVLLVSSAIVFFQHVIIPSYILNDLSMVRNRIENDIAKFESKLRSRLAGKATNRRLLGAPTSGDDISSSEEVATECDILTKELEEIEEFNAAKYLYVSNRLARALPRLPISCHVLQFTTPWPNQSLKEDNKMSDNYDAKFTFVAQSLSKVVLFLLIGLLSVPDPVQDAVIEIVSTSGLGFIIALCIQLYQISPILVFAPVALILVFAYFIVQSSKTSSILTKIKPVSTDEKKPCNSPILRSKHQDLQVHPNHNDDIDVMELGDSTTPPRLLERINSSNDPPRDDGCSRNRNDENLVVAGLEADGVKHRVHPEGSGDIAVDYLQLDHVKPSIFPENHEDIVIKSSTRNLAKVDVHPERDEGIVVEFRAPGHHVLSTPDEGGVDKVLDSNSDHFKPNFPLDNSENIESDSQSSIQRKGKAHCPVRRVSGAVSQSDDVKTKYSVSPTDNNATSGKRDELDCDYETAVVVQPSAYLDRISDLVNYDSISDAADSKRDEVEIFAFDDEEYASQLIHDDFAALHDDYLSSIAAMFQQYEEALDENFYD